MYKFKHEHDLTVRTFKDNYVEFHEYLLSREKLAFVKRLKELTGLGLKEAKDNTDKIFYDGTQAFTDRFHIIEERKNKLNQLKSRIFSKELYEMLKTMSEDEFVDALSKLDHQILEELLEVMLDD
jgi:hypothetical protein